MYYNNELKSAPLAGHSGHSLCRCIVGAVIARLPATNPGVISAAITFTGPHIFHRCADFGFFTGLLPPGCSPTRMSCKKEDDNGHLRRPLTSGNTTIVAHSSGPLSNLCGSCMPLASQVLFGQEFLNSQTPKSSRIPSTSATPESSLTVLWLAPTAHLQSNCSRCSHAYGPAKMASTPSESTTATNTNAESSKDSEGNMHGTAKCSYTVNKVPERSRGTGAAARRFHAGRF